MARQLSGPILIAAMLLAAAQAHAQWSSKSQGGFVMARGNTEAETANAKFEIAYEIEKWKHAFDSAFLYGRSAGITSGQRWDANWQTDHKLSERFFWFGGAALRGRPLQRLRLPGHGLASVPAACSSTPRRRSSPRSSAPA